MTTIVYEDFRDMSFLGPQALVCPGLTICLESLKLICAAIMRCVYMISRACGVNM